MIEQRAKLRRNLVSRLFRLGNAVQTQTQQLLALTSDLSVVQFRILLRLRQAGTQNVQGISELLGANRSLVSRALPDLRDQGWVTLIKSEEDKRQIFVRLTDSFVFPKILIKCSSSVSCVSQVSTWNTTIFILLR